MNNDSCSRGSESPEKADCWRDEFPFLFRLFLSSDTTHPDNYFAGFERRCRSEQATASYRQWDRLLGRLDEESRQDLFGRAAPAVSRRNRGSGRHWSEMFVVLNEAKGYELLRNEGYATVQFVPRSDEPTPDLWGSDGKREAVLEVKTIQSSDIDAKSLGSGIAQVAVNGLPDGLCRKLRSDYQQAKRQCLAYRGSSVARRICLFCMTLDLIVAMNRDNQQHLEKFMRELEDPDVEISYHSGFWSST